MIRTKFFGSKKSKKSTRVYVYQVSLQVQRDTTNLKVKKVGTGKVREVPEKNYTGYQMNYRLKRVGECKEKIPIKGTIAYGWDSFHETIQSSYVLNVVPP